ncbi:type II secretion system F family protein [Telmatospirillum sp.]|uniref:type II secretion system F family protein n=1 Tax=Telmatospirillum sp. TaxID=2079197 RepID=UPI0028523AB3|nr:type II secretion system F family protein [Telmatospirillum sp.]MDR3438186.1 type II secretion system F family protein [Telmatospirillum sp.]
MMKYLLEDFVVFLSSLDLRRLWAKASLSSRSRLRLYGKIASLSRTGMPLPRALDAVWQVTSVGGKRATSPQAFVVDAWRRKVYDGYSFGRALEGWVPEREWTIVEAGSGDLGLALEEASGLIDSSQKMKGAVFTAIGYPLFLSGLLCLLLWIFSVDAIPAFAEVKPMEKWTGLAASMGTLSNAVRAGLFPFLLFCGIAAGVVVWSLPRWTGIWRCRFESLPPWSFYRLVMGTSFLTSLVALLRSGMPIPEALRRLRTTANPWLGERIDAALYFVNSGYDLGEALHLAEHDFPAREIVEDLRIYATLGSLDESMARIAAEWVKQSLDNLRAIGDAMKVGGMALVAATIAWVQLGIIAVQQQLTSGF